MTLCEKGNFVSELATNQNLVKKKINVITYNDLIEEHQTPKFVKIDVEGFEEEVIKGIQKIDKETIFMIEVREDVFIIDFFKSASYLCFKIGDRLEKIDASDQIGDFKILFLLIKIGCK